LFRWIGDQALSHHLQSGGRWAYWRWAILRSAGFPYAPLEQLALAETARLADQILDQEQRFDPERARVGAALTAVPLDGLDAELRKAVLKTSKQVRGGKPPPAGAASMSDRLPVTREPLARWQAYCDTRAQLAQRFATSAADELLAARRRLRELVSDEAVREAVLWQSPHALTGIDALLADGLPVARNHWVRKYEHLAAMYLQRLCAKNDTISYFGPSLILPVQEGETAIDHVPADTLIARRELYFEHWAMAELARAAAADPALRPHLRPRRAPTMWLDGDVLCHPINRRSELPPSYAQLLRVCDGTRSIDELAAQLCDGTEQGFDDRAELEEALDELASNQVLLVDLPLPTGNFHPERSLREALAALPVAVVAPWIERLDALEDAARSLAGARGLADRRAHLAALNERFATATGAAASRAAGKVYGARAIVYEDATRAARSIGIGRPLLERIARPLELLYASASWYTAEVAARVHAHCDQVYASLASAPGTPVDYLCFWSAVENTLSGAIVPSVQAEVHRRWRELLGEAIRPGAPPVVRRWEELAPAVSERFPDTRPGWPQARFMSPDLMIAARDPEAIRRGDYTVVLGEIHVAFSSVCYPLNTKLSDEEPALARALHDDAPGLIAPTLAAEAFHRAAYFFLDDERLRELELGTTRSRLPRSRVLEIGSLLVVQEEGRLVVRARGQTASVPFVALLDHFLTVSSLNFSLLGGAPHIPRITVDGVVLSREKWRVEPPREEPGVEPLLSVRRWARGHGLPRRFFVKLPDEVKPFLVDLDNPFLVELFLKLAHAAEQVSASEMLPGPDELWLADDQGGRYTSELRMTAVRLDGHP
jgi:hypothetical protein